MDADSPHSASCPIDAAVCPHTICHTQCNFVWHIVRALPTTAAHSSGAEQGVDCGVMQSRQRAFCPKPPGASAISSAILNICNLLQFDETFVYWRLIPSKRWHPSIHSKQCTRTSALEQTVLFAGAELHLVWRTVCQWV